jgi:hypothetical protein
MNTVSIGQSGPTAALSGISLAFMGSGLAASPRPGMTARFHRSAANF